MLDKKKLRMVKSWHTTLANKPDSMYDNLVIKFENSNVIQFLSFKRKTVIIFCEKANDYLIKYVPDINFLSLRNRLTKYVSEYTNKKVA